MVLIFSIDCNLSGGIDVDKFVTMLQVNGIEKAYFMVANNMFEVPADDELSGGGSFSAVRLNDWLGVFFY